MAQLGEEPTALGVARHYAGVASGFVLDGADAGLRGAVTELRMRAHVLDTVMVDPEGELRLAADLLGVGRLTSVSGPCHPSARQGDPGEARAAVEEGPLEVLVIGGGLVRELAAAPVTNTLLIPASSPATWARACRRRAQRPRRLFSTPATMAPWERS